MGGAFFVVRRHAALPLRIHVEPNIIHDMILFEVCCECRGCSLCEHSWQEHCPEMPRSRRYRFYMGARYVQEPFDAGNQSIKHLAVRRLVYTVYVLCARGSTAEAES